MTSPSPIQRRNSQPGAFSGTPECSTISRRNNQPLFFVRKAMQSEQIVYTNLHGSFDAEEVHEIASR
jgi:hypothetical protein